MEMRYYKEIIKPKLESGEIIKYESQVQYELLPAFIYNGQKFEAIHYKSDFNIYYSDGNIEVIDVKGLAKPLDIIKRKLLLYRYPNINFKWVCFSKIDSGWCDYEFVKKARAKRKKEKLKEKKINGKKV
jgi:hypothetical protein